MEELIIESWSCIDWTWDHDYELSWNQAEIILQKQPERPKYFYNQWASSRTANACVIFANLSAVWDLMNYKFSNEEILEVVALAEKDYWRSENEWMLMNRWADCVRNWWNKKYPDNQVVSYRLSVWNETYKKALSLWYTIWVSYLISTEYFVDSQDNWIVDSETSKGFKLRWWHAVRTYKDVIADNYIWRKTYNEYKNTKIEKFRDEWCFRNRAYLFAKKNPMTNIFTDVDVTHPFYDSIKLLKEKGIVNWYQDWSFNPNSTITRWEMAAIMSNLINKK